MTVTGGHLIDNVTNNASLPDGAALSYIGVLNSVMADLGSLKNPAEEAFLAVGSALAEASGILSHVQTGFGDLIEHLEGSEAKANAEGLEKAAERIKDLASRNKGSAKALAQLADAVKQIDARLRALSKVVEEVGGLAINAKIQTALIVSGGIDFSVFTSGIQRLGVLAEQTIHQTSARLRGLGQAISHAFAEEQNFEREAAEELAGIQERLVDGLSVMTEQHQAAAAAVHQMGLHSSDTAQRVVACMTELQFNDTACQRIEHVRDAMATVIELLQAGTEDRIDALVGSVCRLQALQLARTAAEYQERVDVLVTHLRRIAKDTANIRLEAEAAMSLENNGADGDGQDTFTGLLEKDIAIGAKLLNQEVAGQQRAKAVVQSVSTGFSEMAGDLEAIHSIDADMRVMGLNATFKCARLGEHGRALGVIAHELRSCSKRTEEISSQISDLLQGAIKASQALGKHESNEAAEVSKLGKWMTNFSLDLGSLSVRLDATLDKLRHDCERAASLLAGTANGIVVHRHMHEALTKAAEKLETVAGMTGVVDADIEAMSERVRALLAGRYTMQSERLIHQIFADCFSAEQESVSLEASAADCDIDDLLF